MLKLSSTKGKFDIVFESDPLTDEKAKISGVRATSAGRRKNLEWKSKVMPKRTPKEPQFSKVKSSKTTQLRNEKIAKKYDHVKKGKKAAPKRQVAAVPEDTVLNTDKDNNPTEKDVIDNEPVPTSKNDKNSLNRRDTYVFPESDAGFISQEQLDVLNKNLNQNEAVEPEAVPGLNLEPSREKETSPSILESLRQDEIRKQQATPVGIYDPWGKPGAGAPTNTVDGGVRTHRNVRLLQNEKNQKLSESLSRNMKDDSSEGSSPSPRDVQTNASPTNLPGKKGSPNPHARGKGKQEHELAEIEKQKLKHLEHHRAIAAQVEEKRLQKQKEKEQKVKEEQEAEERFRKQQELMQQRLDDEKRKEREKQEAKLLKQRMLEEGIKRAQEEAAKVKEDARKARLASKQKTPDTPSNLSSMSPKYRRILHSQNDAIRPSQNFDEEDVLAKFKSLDNTSTKPQILSPKRDSPPIHPLVSDSEEDKEIIPQQTTSSSRIPKSKKTKQHGNKPLAKKSSEEMQSQIVDDYLVPFHRTKTTDMYHDRPDDSEEEEEEEVRVEKKVSRPKKEKKVVKEPSPRSPSPPLNSGRDPDDSEEEEEVRVEKKVSRPKKEKKVVKEPSPRSPPPPLNSGRDPTTTTTTAPLFNNKKAKGKKGERGDKKLATSPQPIQKKVNKAPPPRIIKETDEPISSPSTKRQQEILNRLAELRAGLQQKERECYNTTWSR